MQRENDAILAEILGLAPPSNKRSNNRKARKAAHNNNNNNNNNRGNNNNSDEGEDYTPKRMRPAWDVLARLRWDASMNADEWLIGYEDRFTGIQEVTLEGWDSGYEGLDGVSSFPLHRIRYFKRAGEIVWDRRVESAVKFDHVFGSSSSDE